MAFHKINAPVFAWYGSGGTDPDWGVGSPEHPGHDLPWAPGHPGHDLPWSPGHPSGGPILPPLPGIWPPPGKPSIPVVLPPVMVSPPIYIEGTPEKPIPLPPGTIWPPLPPPGILPSGKHAILIWVVGVGSRWFIHDPQVSGPPVAQPK